MSEAAPEATDAAPTDGDKPQEGEPKTFDADYVDKLRKEAAKYRTEAKTHAEAAKELAAIKDAQKSDAERQAEEKAQLKAEVAAARTEALRFRVASEFGIASDRAELLLTGSDEETMRRQAEALKGEADERKKQGNVVPREGTTDTAAAAGGTPEQLADAVIARRGY